MIKFSNKTNKSGIMETVSLLKTNLRRMGILRWDNSFRSKILTVTLNCVAFGLYLSYALIAGSYLIFTAKNENEFTMGTIQTFSSVFVILWYSFCISNKKEIETLLDDLDAIIEKSK